MGHKILNHKTGCRTISVEDIDLNKIDVLLALEDDVLIVPTMENRVIRSKPVMSCMGI